MKQLALGLVRVKIQLAYGLELSLRIWKAATYGNTKIESLA